MNEAKNVDLFLFPSSFLFFFGGGGGGGGGGWIVYEKIGLLAGS